MAYKRTHPDFGGASKLPSGRWRARYRMNGKQWAADRTFLTEDLALEHLDHLAAEMQRFDWAGPSALSEITFEEWAQRWMARPVRKKGAKSATPKKPRTAQDYQATFQKHIFPLLGAKAVGDISVGVVRAFQDTLGKKLASHPVALNKAQRYASYVLGYAREKGAIRMNPFDHDDIFIADPRERREINEDICELDIERLREAFPDHLKPVVNLAAYVGPRAGEIWALKNRSVNLIKGELNITQACSEITGEGVVFHLPKNGKTRKVALPGFVVDELREHIKGGPDDPLFPNTRNKQMRHANFTNKVWTPVRRATDLTELHFHDLRHYCAIHHISQGYELADISALLGHSSINVTYNLYGGINPGRRQAMARSVDAAYRAFRDGNPSEGLVVPLRATS